MSTIPIRKFSEKKDISEAKLLKPTPLNRDWKGDELQSGVSFIFAVDPEMIHFIAIFSIGKTGALPSAPRAPSSNFVEGLWRYDVAEFFLVQDNSEDYQEFNLAPYGDWWSAKFSGYRNPLKDVDCHMKGVTTFLEVHENRALFGISVLRRDLKVQASFGSETKLNVTAITHNPDEAFLSYAPNQHVEPDFHRIQTYCYVRNC